MGRVDAHSSTAASLPAAAVPQSAPLLHFTHPHDLHILSFYNPQTLCSGCKLQSSGIMYTCIPCNFTLHQSCAKLPQFITHPSHSGCTLSLLTVSSYPGGIFRCNACSRRGDNWNYHCAHCKYDLHVSCASKPLKIRIQAHSSCELDLVFKNPYMNSDRFSCDICQQTGSNQWLYRCNSCQFDVHLDCTKDPQPTLQHHHSAPATAPTTLHHNQLMHSTSLSGINVNGQFQAPAAQFNGFVRRPPPRPHLTHSASTGAIGNPHRPNMYYWGPINTGQTYGSSPGNLMMSAIQEFVEGAFQGQEVVQEVIGGGGDSYGGDGYDGYGGDGGDDGYGGDGGDGYGGDGGDGDVYSY